MSLFILRAPPVTAPLVDQVVAAVHEITGGAGADIVFEMVGHQEQTINECLDLVKEGGKVYGATTVLAFAPLLPTIRVCIVTGCPGSPKYPWNPLSLRGAKDARLPL